MTSTDLREIVAANLRAERARRGLRQSDLAERAGLARATYADAEAGRRRLALEEAVAVCAALDVGLADLLAGSDPEATRARAALQVVTRSDLEWLAERIVPRESLERLLQPGE